MSVKGWRTGVWSVHSKKDCYLLRIPLCFVEMQDLPIRALLEPEKVAEGHLVLLERPGTESSVAEVNLENWRRHRKEEEHSPVEEEHNKDSRGGQVEAEKHRGKQ